MRNGVDKLLHYSNTYQLALDKQVKFNLLIKNIHISAYKQSLIISIVYTGYIFLVDLNVRI